MESNPVMTLDAALTIETNPLAPATPAQLRDYHPGELIDTRDGMLLAALFGRHNPSRTTTIHTINIATWTMEESNTPRMIFGEWRLGIEMSGLKPVYWTPQFEAAS
jgi:hypothetical protein